MVINAIFKHKWIHKYTREDPSKSKKSIIDYIMISREIMKYVKDVKVNREAEIGSDHYLLLNKWKITQEKRENPKRKIIKE